MLLLMIYVIVKGYVHTKPGSFCAAKENHSGITHKNGDFGATSVMERSCAAPILKVDCHITDEVFYHTLVRVTVKRWVGVGVLKMLF